MSTANKLTYLNTTKGKIKDSINLTGANIGSNDTFRSYSAKLRDGLVDIINNGTDTLYNNFPKATGSGTDLTLNNTYQAPIKIDLKGNTSQDTSTASKNILDLTNLDFLGAGTGLTVNSTFENTIGITATSSVSNWGGLSYSVTKLLQTNKKYFFGVKSSSSNIINSAGRYGTIGIYSYNKGTNTRVNAYEISLTDLSMRFTSFTPDVENYDYRLTFFPQSGVVPEQTTNYIYEQLYLAQEESSSEYVPFVPNSPSPDYPQNIEVVTGNNSITICSKNLWDEEWESGALSESDGTTITNANKIRSKNYILIKPNTSYYWNKNTQTGTLYFYDKNKAFINFVNLGVGTFTSPANAYYLKFNVGSNSTPITTYSNDIIISIGSTATTYEAYQGATYPVNLGSIELCKIGDYQDEIRKSTGKNLFDKNDITQNYYVDKDTGELISNSSNNVSNYIKINSNNIVISGGTNNAYYALYNNSKTYIRGGQYTNETPLNTENASYIIFTINKSNNLSTTQLEQGLTPTEYEPYGVGVWYKYGKIGKVVLDGSESDWAKSSVLTNTTAYQINTDINYDKTSGDSANAYVNYFKANANGYHTDKECFWFNSNGYFRVRINTTTASTLNDFKTWLSNNNTIAYYVLATPTSTEITNTTLKEQLEAIYNAISYNNQTNISQENADLPFIISASALLREE